MKMKYYLAVDIGASSGRHIIGYKENNELKTVEIYRFPNGVKEENGHLIWDIKALYQNVLEGIRIALEKYGEIESMSIDTWGVDYVLLDKNDEEILPVYAYRDTRCKEVIPLVHNIIPFDELYEITGSQFQEFNTVYQLYKDKMDGRLKNAECFLHIPEYLMFKLTGVKIHEYTNASTTGMLDGRSNTYSDEIIHRLGLKESLFTKLYKPGFILGGFTPSVKEIVAGSIKVKLCPTHDTASAVEGIPMKKNAPYISSGTWSLLGIKSRSVITSEEAKNANYSNEYGPDYIRFQKNIMGLWIIQGLSKQMGLAFKDMVNLAKESKYMEIFDVNDKVFLSSLDMKNEIIKWFKVRHMKLPKCDGDIINATYRSLAESYRIAINELEGIIGEKFDDLYIVGGGAKNNYLNELTEQATLHHVIALPIEATAIGNLLSQMKEK